MKRFIAGAHCPGCNQQDSLFFESSEAEDRVHCSRCDYTELRATEVNLNSEPDGKEADKESSIKWH